MKQKGQDDNKKEDEIDVGNYNGDGRSVGDNVDEYLSSNEEEYVSEDEDAEVVGDEDYATAEEN